MGDDQPDRPGRGMGGFLKGHRALYVGSGGAKGHIVDTRPVGTPRFSPCLVLRTHGRKSGDLYQTPLTYGLFGDEWVVVASKGGSPDHPAWYLNLAASPECEIQIATQRFRCSWREAEGEERARVWDYMCGLYAPFTDYARKMTSRVIPVIMLRILEEITDQTLSHLGRGGTAAEGSGG
jgi:deazaflavin-dependent oxidoreductase (nitroreductase family)